MSTYYVFSSVKIRRAGIGQETTRSLISTRSSTPVLNGLNYTSHVVTRDAFCWGYVKVVGYKIESNEIKYSRSKTICLPFLNQTIYMHFNYTNV